MGWSSAPHHPIPGNSLLSWRAVSFTLLISWLLQRFGFTASLCAAQNMFFLERSGKQCMAESLGPSKHSNIMKNRITPHVITCQLLPVSNKRKMKTEWERQERDMRWWKVRMKDIRVRELLVYLVCPYVCVCPRRPSWKGMICDWCMAKTDGCVCLSVCLPACLPAWLAVCSLSVCLCLSVSVCVCLSVCFFPRSFSESCARASTLW